MRRLQRLREDLARAPESIGRRLKVQLLTYGCQMNVADSQLIRGILQKHHDVVKENDDAAADVVLLNGCAVRDHAEETVLNKIEAIRAEDRKQSRPARVVGVLGCMAQRRKQTLLEQGVADLVAGPDSYRTLPKLLSSVVAGKSELNANLLLDVEETYAELPSVVPAGATNAFVSIMRGCNNMCSFCIVPFVRGRERSRAYGSVEEEVRRLVAESGIRDVTLLGQNVNSYNDTSEGLHPSRAHPVRSAETFTTVYQPPVAGAVDFAELLHRLAKEFPTTRFRFTSPHPKDFPPHLLDVIGSHRNIANQLHLPAQSGSSAVLREMKRGYTAEAYRALVHDVRRTLGDRVGLSTDMMTGFCGETEEDHQQSLQLMRDVDYDMAYMFHFSVRERTHAHRKLQDDVPVDVKKRRLQEMIELFHRMALARNRRIDVGRDDHVVAVERRAKKKLDWVGKNDAGKRVVFSGSPDLVVGDWVRVQVDDCTAVSLLGKQVGDTLAQPFIP